MREAIEFDLLTLPGGGIDLGDLYRDRLSIRRLRVVLDHLPSSAASVTLQRRRRHAQGIETGSTIETMPQDAFSQSEWFLVLIHDQLQRIAYVTEQVHSPGKVPLPEPLPRPMGITKRRRTLNTVYSALGLAPAS